MELKVLLEGLDYTTAIQGNTNVTAIARDSRDVKEGSIFFAIVGHEVDGHLYAEKALASGAVAVVVQKDLGLVEQILVDDSHQAYGVVAGNLFGNPSRKLKLIGVTGTNGKTTTAYIVKGILDSIGKRTGLIGTVENLIGDVSIQAKFTTPDPIQLHSLFSRMVEAGCEYVVMEVSSHAMEQQRIAGCHFAASAFTNLTQDHLDYHKTMENYYNAKKSLFHMGDSAIVNLDDSYGRRLLLELEGENITFSTSNEKADLFAEDIVFSAKGSSFVVQYKGEKKSAHFVQPGLFSVSNALAALGLALAVGIDFDEAVEGLRKCPPISGRFEIFPLKKDYTVIRDFAHTPDGLEKLLSTVKTFAEGRVVTLFGCAGERDREKRKTMSRVVAKYSDFCILAPDNPRSEPVEQINSDAEIGFKGSGTPYKVFEDRFDAILWALQNSKSRDILILAGKGHEDYQVLDYGTINFNEKEIVLNFSAAETTGYSPKGTPKGAGN